MSYGLIISAIKMLTTKNYQTFEIPGLKTFSGAKNAQRCLPGDTVESTETGCKLIKRADHPVLAGLIELNSKVRYGFSARNVPIYLFTPFNESYPPFVVGCSERDCSKNRLALVKFESWTETYPRGILQRLLPLGHEEEALSWTYSPRACERYKGEMPQAPDLKNRRQLQGHTFHIDPVGCRDVDDVISVFYNQGNEDIEITITIADVAATVQQGSPLDERAAQIAQTFYQDGNEPRHMFPRELSEEALSLLPGTPKAGLSLSFSVWNPRKVTWFESVVETQTTYTYDTIYGNQLLCDALETMSSTLGEPTNDSHKWIEVAMKFYNTEAAKIIRQAKQGVLRAHTAPQEEKLNRLMKFNPELKFLAYAAANYIPATAEKPHHWGLGTDLYTHASSPIRRYADLINQRVLKAFLNGTTEQTEQVNIAHLNRVAKAAKQHDRDLVFLRAIQKEPTAQVAGEIIDMLPVDEDKLKISVYLPTWKYIVKLIYTRGMPSEGIETVVSKDEKETHDICVGKRVMIAYHADLTARTWKRRMVFRLTA